MCDVSIGFSSVILVYPPGEERDNDNCRYAIFAPDKFLKRMSKSQINSLVDYVFPELGKFFAGPVALMEGTCYKDYSSQSIFDALWKCAKSNNWEMSPFVSIEPDVIDEGIVTSFRFTPIRLALVRQFLD